MWLSQPILYETDVVPVSSDCISDLDVIQNKLGKSLLGVPPFTGNPVTGTCGWKPFHLLFKRVNDLGFKGSPLVAACIPWNVLFVKTLYMKNLRETLFLYSSGDDFLSHTIKDLC